MVPVTATDLGQQIAAGERDPVDVAEHYLAEAFADTNAAYIRVTAERARDEARRSADRMRHGRSLGPLDGVPVAWKDIFDIAGTPTTAGSATLRDAPAAANDAACVAHLTAAGMVCLGKTNLSEFAYSGLGLNPHFGTPRNPAAPGRVPGGSSSGSAVAVAAGAAPCAIGTDTSGSVRVPAAFTGLVGYKPTHDRYSRQGVMPLAPTLDSVGILTRTVRDLPVLDAALRALPHGLPHPPDPAQLRIAVPAGELISDCTPAIARRFHRVLELLASEGARIISQAIPALLQGQDLLDRHGTLVAAEAYRTHKALLQDARAAQIDHRIRARLLSGAAISPDSYLALRQAIPQLQQALAEQLDGSLVLYPTVRHPPPELAPLEASDDRFARANQRTLRNTMLASYLDLPGIALPAGRDGEQQPISVLISALPGHDESLLSAAMTIEQILAPLNSPQPELSPTTHGPVPHQDWPSGASDGTRT